MTIPINTMMVTILMIKTPKPIKSGQTYWPLPRPNCPIATVSLNHKLYVEAKETFDEDDHLFDNYPVFRIKIYDFYF